MASSVWVIVTLFFVVAQASLVPTHVYLSLTGDASQMQVTFTTSSKPTSAMVSYGLDGSDAQSSIAVSASDIHAFTRPVTGKVDYISSITLKSLERGVVYTYQIIGDSSTHNVTSSQVFKFRNVPVAEAPVTIGIYGDLGAYGYALMQTKSSGLPKYAQSGKFDIIVHNGDLAYNLGSSNGAVGDTFMDHLQQISAVVPYMVTPGNHEFKDSGADEQYYNNMWIGQDLLGKSSKSTQTRMWYSFDIGSVHVVGISTEAYCEDTGNIAAQYAWLENDLQTASSRSDRPWIIVLGHRPLYRGTKSYFYTRLLREGVQCTDASLKSCDPQTVCNGKNCAYSLQDLLFKYKVDLYNSGHEHEYVRNNPIAQNLTYESHKDDNNYINPQHPVHVVSGAAGTASSPDNLDVVVKGASPRVLKKDTPSIVETASYSFSVVVAYNNTHINYKQISAEDGTTVDDFWIVKNKDAPSFKFVSFALKDDGSTSCAND